MCLSRIIPHLLATGAQASAPSAPPSPATGAAAPVRAAAPQPAEVAEPAAPSATPRPRGPDPGRVPGHDPGGEPGRTPVPVSVALLNGCGGAVGASLAEALGERGVAVGLLARSGEEAATAMARLRAAGADGAWAVVDAADPAAVAAAVVAIRARLGPVDLLVNDAGGRGPGGRLWEVDLGAWWGSVETALKGALLCTRLVLPGMVGRGHGRILNLVDAGAAHRPPAASARSVSAAAIRAFTEDLARETRGCGIAALSVDPHRRPIGVRPEAPTGAVGLLLRLAAGDGDALSGRHLTVHDDLDALLAATAPMAQPRRTDPISTPIRMPTVVPAPAAVPARSGRRRPNRAPAYYLGRPAALWQEVMSRAEARRLPAASLFDRAA